MEWKSIKFTKWHWKDAASRLHSYFLLDSKETTGGFEVGSNWLACSSSATKMPDDWGVISPRAGKSFTIIVDWKIKRNKVKFNCALTTDTYIRRIILVDWHSYTQQYFHGRFWNWQTYECVNQKHEDARKMHSLRQDLMLAMLTCHSILFQAPAPYLRWFHWIPFNSQIQSRNGMPPRKL